MSQGPARRGNEKHKRIDRRSWLKAIGVAGAAGLAGCSGGGGGGGDGTSQSGGGNGSNGSQPSNATNGSALGGDGNETGNQSNETSSGGVPEVGGTYSTITSSSPETLNPLYNTEDGAGDLISYALDLGYGFRPGTEYFPRLYDMTTDQGNVWVAKLRENLEFGGDYGEVTAEDFVYQITELHQSEWAATADASSWPSEVNVEATGDYEFQIELPNSNALYPETYDPLLYPIPMELMQPYVEEQNADGLRQDEELLGLGFAGNMGAYTLDSRNRSSSLTYKRNENYYLRDAEGVPERFSEAPYFDTLEVQIVPESQSRLAALEAGETDSASVPFNRVSKFRNLERTDVYVIPQPYNEVCVYNMRDNGWNAGPGNLFRKKKFRQGLGCAVNKQRLSKGVFRGFADVEYTWQPQWSKWYPDDNSNIMQFGTGDLYGPEATQSRIKEAISDTDYGYSGGNLKNPNGETVTLSLYHSAGQPTERSMADFIAQEFKQNAGINVEVSAIQGAQFSREYWQQQIPDNPDQYEWSEGSNNAGPREVTSANPWDMTVVFGLNTYPLNPTTASVFFQKDSAYNPYGYYPSWNASELFERASNATSEEELQPIFNEIFAKISEDQPMGMLAFPADTIGYATGINGPQENFFSEWDFSAWYRNG
ncbi:ABC transporter substrate-binding protein [Halococcus saccharolyticus]|uniref:Extracellular solute-binding protein family 5 n=1 Tax=Halococcus saccharolyticus DSM 5350 TaxID=1227455 RepID=M0ML79_9EURY|nr:ABC transporter substrate-binding protein [Halococcus saccharolyticus]EMA45484.1 extracellular solute-binding protein family 5 [Halococcus saccharolyticus DSM 5350]